MEDWIKDKIGDALYLVSGIILLLIGIVLLVLPGPGILFIIFGVLLLGKRFIVFRKPANKIKEFLQRFKRKVNNKK